MPPPLTDNDLLARYLSGDITAGQQAELERRALSDPDLQAALDGLYAHPGHDHAATLDHMLTKATNSLAAGPALKPTAKVRRLPRYWWAAAATLLLLLAALVAFPLITDDPGPEIALQLDEADPAPETVVSSPPQREPAPTNPAPAPADRPTPAARSGEPAADEPITATTLPEPASVLREGAAPALEPAVSDDAYQSQSATPPPPPLPVDGPAPVQAESEPAAMDVSVSPPDERRPATGEDEEIEAREEIIRSRSPKLQRDLRPQISGRVTDEYGRPIPNATLRRPGLPLSEPTDSNGVFRLDADATLTELLVEAEGYDPESIELTGNRNDLQITLDAVAESTDAFSDNASTGQTFYYSDGLLQPQLPSYARSRMGYRDLRKTLTRNYPPNLPGGKVKFNFVAHPDGLLSDFSFPKDTDQATQTYLIEQLRELDDYEVVGEEPVRIFLKVNL